MLDLATGWVVTRPKVTPVTMTDMVISRVEEMAVEQGLKSMKFFNRKRELTLTAADLLEGVGGQQNVDEDVENQNFDEFIDDDNEHGADLPQPEDVSPPGGLLDGDDVELEDVKEIDGGELADLLDDEDRDGGIQMECGPDGKLYYVESPEVDVGGGDHDPEELNEPGMCKLDIGYGTESFRTR